MTVRTRKKKNRLRGHRTHGKGDTKNKRGAGSRGGRGRAGSHKHKFTKYAGEFGTEKKKVIGKPIGPSINLDQIEQFLPQWIKNEKAKKEGNKVILDGRKIGFAKIVGRGELKSTIVFENFKASKKAAEKIKQSGSELTAKEKNSEQAEEEKAEEKADGHS